MKADAKKILEEAMHLEPSTRALIAETLLESLDFEENFEISQAWQDEIQRRCEQIDRGEVELIDFDTVMAELRKKQAWYTSGGPQLEHTVGPSFSERKNLEFSHGRNDSVSECAHHRSSSRHSGETSCANRLGEVSHLP